MGCHCEPVHALVWQSLSYGGDSHVADAPRSDRVYEKWAAWLQAAQHNYHIIPKLQSQWKVSSDDVNLYFIQIRIRYFI